MNSVNDFNTQIINEFRANEGKVGGPFAGATVLLLTHTGAKSGKKRTNPLVYLSHGDRMYVFASKGGAATNPDWYHNLLANPAATVEVGTETYEVAAKPVTGEERDRIFGIQSDLRPVFAEYQRNTRRRIPVVELVRR
jgi:deazaflavin-dependent oxidoreductase (nitroreductase family)